MEKTSSEPHIGTIASHFSHPHPLKLIIHNQTLNLSSSPCSGCKLKPSGMLYSCTICNYYLHKNCFEMPRQLTHAFDKKHALTLLPKPAYGDTHFKCDACGEKGNGFSYNCKPCGLDLHVLCATMPLSLTCEFHMHKLDLTFQSPYTRKFSCAICQKPGSRYWLYRCISCGFDAHFNCVRQRVPPLPRQQHMMPGGLPVEVNREKDDVSLRIVLQVVSNNQGMAQAVLPAGSSSTGGSGGGGGGNMGLHQLMQLISSLNDIGGIGGDQEFVVEGATSAVGDGGIGGGVDTVLSLLGDGNGLAFLGGLLGGL